MSVLERRVERVSKGKRYELVYRGARVADVLVDGRAVDAIEVGDWDWQRGEQRRRVRDDELSAELVAWINHHEGA